MSHFSSCTCKEDFLNCQVVIKQILSHNILEIDFFLWELVVVCIEGQCWKVTGRFSSEFCVYHESKKGFHLKTSELFARNHCKRKGNQRVGRTCSKSNELINGVLNYI